MMQDTNENEIKQSPARTSGQNVGENETPLESESFGAVSKRFLKALINYIRGLTVEPIIFLIYLGWIFGNTLQSYGIYERLE
ncbi:hypothetical protein AB6A40_009233 [Gnathostoma spinigerum]|uniref:Uncharacterized protein n=1 Tax=Gnathostoma spinigerum TaxID=75299 RepID=A0ABD6EWF7_9BILA